MTRQVISIIGQIAEIDREIAMRDKVYPHQISSGKMRDAEANMLMDRIRAVRETLVFCRDNEAEFREFMRCRAEFKAFLAARQSGGQPA